VEKVVGISAGFGDLGEPRGAMNREKEWRLLNEPFFVQVKRWLAKGHKLPVEGVGVCAWKVTGRSQSMIPFILLCTCLQIVTLWVYLYIPLVPHGSISPISNLCLNKKVACLRAPFIHSFA
jgi:hypothetical protein